MHPLHQLIHSFSPINEKSWQQLFEHCEELTIAKGKNFIREGEKEILLHIHRIKVLVKE